MTFKVWKRKTKKEQKALKTRDVTARAFLLGRITESEREQRFRQIEKKRGR